MIVFVFGLALLGGACGWVLREQVVDRYDEMLRESRYLQTLLVAHRMFVRDAPADMLLPPSEFGRLADAIGRRLGVVLSLPKTGDGSLAFRGRRLLPIGRRPAALLIFEHGERRVSLIVLRDEREDQRADLHRRVRNTSILIAEDGDLELGVVGEVAPDEVELLKQIVDERSGEI